MRNQAVELFWKVSYSRCFFLSCVSQDPDICGRGRTFCFYLIPHPQISQTVFLFADNQIQSKSFFFIYSKDFQGENLGNRTKNDICSIGGEHVIPQTRGSETPKILKRDSISVNKYKIFNGLKDARSASHFALEADKPFLQPGQLKVNAYAEQEKSGAEILHFSRFQLTANPAWCLTLHCLLSKRTCS